MAKLRAVDDEALIPASVRIYNRIRPLQQEADEARIAVNEAKKEIKRAGMRKDVHTLCSKFKKRDILEAQSFKDELDRMWDEFGFNDQARFNLEPVA